MEELERENSTPVEDRKHNAAKIGIFGFLALFLIWAGFNAGMYASGRNEIIKNMAREEAVFIGNLTGKYSTNTPGTVSQDVDFKLFWEVWDIMKNNYVDKEGLTDKKMFYGALNGLVASADDPYTVFMNPSTSQEFSDDLAGKFEGVGAEIGIKNDILTVVAPLPEMPAEKAGIMAGDRILAIDGENTAGITVDQAVNKIRGPKDTEVILTIAREGIEGVSEYRIKRSEIVVKSVRTRMLDGNIFLIEITNFNEDTENLFNAAVREALDKNPDGIILDLRNNPGGFFNTSIEMASEWVENEVVVKEQIGGGESVREHLARGRARLKDFKTVVLINQGSASASEIVSGALQDHGKAVLVGNQTFGKGSVQTLLDLTDGSSVKITVAKWLTPNGRSITEEGVAPDVKVDLTPEDFSNNRDPQMDKAVEILKNFDKLDQYVDDSDGNRGTSTEEVQ